jgi:arylsulfatase A-like enzyme
MDKVEELLSQRSTKPFFLFLHLFDVHPDFDPPPPYDRLFDPEYSGSVNGIDIMNNPAVHRDMDRRDLEHLLALYDGEIRFVDEAGIKRLVSILEKHNLTERTLLVITSDHGEEFFEHGVFGHRQNLYDTTLRIPLIFWSPALVPAGLVVKEEVGIIDVMPTILDLLGLRPSPEGLGKSLVPFFEGQNQKADSRPVFCEVQSSEVYMEGLRTEKYKIIRNYKGDKSEEKQYFDLANDPGERLPLMDPEQDEYKRAWDAFVSFRWDLATYKDALSWTVTDAPKMDRELRERLKSLGYIKDKKDKREK